MANELSVSWWVLYAGVGGLVAGQLYLFAKVPLSVGGGLRTFFEAVRSRLICLIVMMIVDALGGLTTAGALLYVQASGPGRIGDLINNVPWLGWMAVGAVGPIVSDRILTGSLVRGRFESVIWSEQATRADKVNKEIPRLRGTAWRLRSEAVAAIEARVTILQQTRLLEEIDHLRSTAHRFIEDDPERSKAAFVYLVRAFNRADPLPRPVMNAFERLASSRSSNATSIALQKALVRELIDSQAWSPLESLASAGIAAPKAKAVASI